YDPATSKYIYDYQGDKFFVPASNTKIITCYVAMKYLKHILPGIKYYENDTAIYLIPTGDPTLLHRDFLNQPVIKFLQQQKKKLYITGLIFKDDELGRGWSWDDYNEFYMTERNALPVYGNTIKWLQEKVPGQDTNPQESVSVFSDPEVNWKLRFEPESGNKEFHVQRERTLNIFHVTQGQEAHARQEVPFAVNGIQSALELLADTVGKEIMVSDHFKAADPLPQYIWSQPVDSVLRPMMYRSDNFFAEQLLEMVSAERIGVMSDALVIDTILKTDLAALKQRPVWVDGSVMSRYNLFSPHTFIDVLDKMKNEFGMDRIKAIFPAGDSGTLKGFYKGDSSYVYAKTGSMSGVIALSGFLYTKTGRLLEFSILVNNYKGNSVAIKRRMERFLNEIR
ncbi:MAG: D-alanyl-D-alanine carboxypeptidase/D-alanyl-D-alanine-endopeptidase, partial [Chitinophagaceae bacterium]|nr:D-alanyl-D-alanine carboxypeptidase/D-alanyl-D-alanine-endopeptidase [Chitinophagaceae bacterium]